MGSTPHSPYRSWETESYGHLGEALAIIFQKIKHHHITWREGGREGRGREGGGREGRREGGKEGGRRREGGREEKSPPNQGKKIIEIFPSG